MWLRQAISSTTSLRATYQTTAPVSSLARYSAINFSIQWPLQFKMLDKTYDMYLEIILIESFEGGRQNMMGFVSRPYIRSWKKLLYPTLRCISQKKTANQQRNAIKKYRRSDPIHAVMKLARSRYLCYNGIAPNVSTKYIQLSSGQSDTDSFIW